MQLSDRAKQIGYGHARLEWVCRGRTHPGKVGGEWLFKDTRVPVKALFENLESGARIDDFLTWFPGVTRDQVELVLRHAERSGIERVQGDVLHANTSMLALARQAGFAVRAHPDGAWLVRVERKLGPLALAA